MAESARLTTIPILKTKVTHPESDAHRPVIYLKRPFVYQSQRIFKKCDPAQRTPPPKLTPLIKANSTSMTTFLIAAIYETQMVITFVKLSTDNAALTVKHPHSSLVSMSVPSSDFFRWKGATRAFMQRSCVMPRVANAFIIRYPSVGAQDIGPQLSIIRDVGDVLK